MSGRVPYGELRADWLKLRGCLFDPMTRLPALPAVVNDVRRRLEVGEEVGLVYVELPSGEGELANGWRVHDRLILRIAEALTAFRDRVLGERSIVAQLGVRSDQLVVFVDLEDGPQTFDRRHRQLVAELEAALTGDFDAAPMPRSAWVPLRPEPKVRHERSIYAAVARAQELCRRAEARLQGRRLGELRRMLEASEISTRFQPIVDLAAGGVYGYEALSSAPGTEPFESPETLFTFAEESHLIVELERLCRQGAFGAFGSLSSPAKLFLNCSAHAFGDPDLVEDLAAGAEAQGLAPSDVVLEITERVAITEWQEFRQRLGEVRQAGFRVAIDDMGSGYSSLHVVGEIRPDYLKVDATLVHRLHESAIKRDLLEALAGLARKIGARPIAEGIEVAEELAAVRSLGVSLGQGFLFARPQSATVGGAVRFAVPPRS
ncbi:MAG: EAL domain-containing protein [Acidobacteriota bacterium]